MKKMFFGLACAGMVMLCGCRVRTQLVAVDVIPADAKVIANGVAYDNHSPLFIEADTGKQLVITAYKEGYRDKIYVIDYSLSTLGKIEAWTAFLVLPAFGLMADNAWRLNENNVELTLEPLTPEAKAEAALAQPRMIPAYSKPLEDKTELNNFNQL